MADFTCFEAEASDESNDEDEKMDIDNDLINDSENQENDDVNFFRFQSQTTDTDEVLREAAAIEAVAAENMEPNNYNEYDRETMPVNEFQNFEQKRELFLRTLKNPIENQTKENSFYSVLLYAIRSFKTKKDDFCEQDELENEVGTSLYSKLESKKEQCILNLIKRDFDYM